MRSLAELFGEFGDDPGGIVSFVEAGCFNSKNGGLVWPSHGFYGYDVQVGDPSTKTLFTYRRTSHPEFKEFEEGQSNGEENFHKVFRSGSLVGIIREEIKNQSAGGGAALNFYKQYCEEMFYQFKTSDEGIYTYKGDDEPPLIVNFKGKTIMPPIFTCSMLQVNDIDLNYVFNEAPWNPVPGIPKTCCIFKNKQSYDAASNSPNPNVPFEGQIFPPPNYGSGAAKSVRQTSAPYTGSNNRVDFLKNLYSKKTVFIRNADESRWTTFFSQCNETIQLYTNVDLTKIGACTQGAFCGGLIQDWISKPNIYNPVKQTLGISGDVQLALIQNYNFKFKRVEISFLNVPAAGVGKTGDGGNIHPVVTALKTSLLPLLNGSRFFNQIKNADGVKGGQYGIGITECNDTVEFVSSYYYNSMPSIGAFSNGWFCYVYRYGVWDYVGPCGMGLPSSSTDRSILNKSYSIGNYCKSIGMSESDEPKLTYAYTYEPKLYDNINATTVGTENITGKSGAKGSSNSVSISKPSGYYDPFVINSQGTNNSSANSTQDWSGTITDEINHFLNPAPYDETPSAMLTAYDAEYNGIVQTYKNFAIGTLTPTGNSNSFYKSITNWVGMICNSESTSENTSSGGITRTIDVSWTYQYSTSPNPGVTYTSNKDETTGKVTSSSSSTTTSQGQPAECNGTETNSSSTESQPAVSPRWNCKECTYNQNETGYNLKLSNGPEFEDEDSSQGGAGESDCLAVQGTSESNSNSLSKEKPVLTRDAMFSNENGADKHRSILLNYLTVPDAPQAKYYDKYTNFNPSDLNTKVKDWIIEYNNNPPPGQSLNGFINQKLDEEGYRVGAHASSYSFFTDWKVSYYYGATKITACRGYTQVSKPQKVSYLKLSYNGMNRSVAGDYFEPQETKLSFMKDSIICKANAPTVTEETFTIQTNNIFSQAHTFESSDNSSILTTITYKNWTLKEQELINKFCGQTKDKRTGQFLKDIYLTKGYRINEGDVTGPVDPGSD